MIWIVMLAILFLSGCSSYKTDYPATCDLKQTDADGKGYTKAVFPCKLTHYEGKGP